MKHLGIFRHAKSDWGDRGQRDFDRGLNDRGWRGAALMGRHIRHGGTDFSCLLASPAARVRQTLDGAELGIAPVFDERLYLASAETMMDIVRELAGDADAVLLAGHNPGLQDLLLTLVSKDHETAEFREAMVKFPTASHAVLELPIDEWGKLGTQDARLVHFMRPRDLDPTLGPTD